PLGAVGEHPAHLDADTGRPESARLHEPQDLGRRLALLGGTGEVDAAELDAVPARRPCGAQRVGQRRRFEGPGVEREPGGHCLAAGAAAGGGDAFANATASFTSASACLTSSSAFARWPPNCCSARSRWRRASSSALPAA